MGIRDVLGLFPDILPGLLLIQLDGFFAGTQSFRYDLYPLEPISPTIKQ